MGTEYDGIVVGSGPNGLVAAVTLATAGWRVLVVEAAPTPGGGTRSAELTLPGFVHDVCSAVHPLALASSALRDLPLNDHGLEWIHPDLPLAHPLDDGRAALLHRSVDVTAAGLGPDAGAYRRLLSPRVRQPLIDGLMAPFDLPPRAPISLGRFGAVGLQPADFVARTRFRTEEARALFGGLAAHSILSLRSPATAAYGLMLGSLAHLVGWPVARGGSQTIADALVSLLRSLGGEVEVGRTVTRIEELPPARAVLFDVTPTQLVSICGHRLPDGYRRRLARFRRGPGVWKVDWALDGPVPWPNPDVGRAATVHLGGTLPDLVTSERDVQHGRLPASPYVIFVQAARFDRSRAPGDGETGWAYCHVPNGSTFDMTERIEAQVERFAPGFRDRILERHVMSPARMQEHNPNYLGGDINGGAADLRQFVARPVLSPRPWSTPAAGIYLCSASTPPGGGVHGMCGLHAARAALRDLD